MERQLDFISMAFNTWSDSFLHLRCAAFGVLMSLISVIVRVCCGGVVLYWRKGVLMERIADVGIDRGAVLGILRDRSMD